MDQQPFDQSSVPPAYTQPVEQKPANGYATASLVLGIISAVATCAGCGCITPITAILGIVFACVSRQGKPMRGTAIGGLIASILSLLLFIVAVVLVVVVVMNDPAFMEEFQKAFEQGYQAGLQSGGAFWF